MRRRNARALRSNARARRNAGARCIARALRGNARALRRIARIRNDRHAYLLKDGAGAVVAEFVDDHVRAVDELRGVETRWCEWEFELGPAAPAGRADRAALLEAATEIALAAGARPAASDSKLARTLGV